MIDVFLYIFPAQEATLDNSGYSPLNVEEILRNSKAATPASARPPSAGRKSALKTRPSTERRKSRRSVAFALSPQKEGTAPSNVSLPSTPFNRDSLGKERQF
jgi:hypothetical protein